MTKEELKAAREYFKNTQTELAVRLGVTTQTVWRWESGATDIPKWLDSWFKGEFGPNGENAWRAIIAHWYGQPFKVLDETFPTPEAALAKASQKAKADRWSFSVPSASVVIIERE